MDDQGAQPHHFQIQNSKFIMSQIQFSTRRVRKSRLQLDTSKSKGPDDIPVKFPKAFAPDLAPIIKKVSQLYYTLGTFLTSWKQAHVSPIPTKATNQVHSTIVPLQSLHSSLKQWKPSSRNSFLPS